MAEDAGGAFEVGSAYVSVSPDAETFPEQLDEQLGGLDYVVTIPVRADTAGLQESVDAAAADAQAAIVLPVTADPAGLKESVDAASASSGAVITVPLEADPADLAPQADAAATAAGETAGTSFGEKFSSVAGQMSLFEPDEGQIAGAGGAAGDAAGKSFGEGFDAAASAAGAGLGAEITPEATAAGGEAGTAAGEGFLSRLASMLSGVTSLFTGLVPAAAAEGSAAGGAAGAAFGEGFAADADGRLRNSLGQFVASGTEAGAAAGEGAGEGFASRFAAMMSGVTGAFSGLVPGLEAEGAAAGTATGESFGASLKGVLMGSISPMEALLGGAFVAATADMASHFQSAMELVHTQAGVAQSAIAGLSGQVLTLAGKVGESPDSLAQALYHVESSFQSVGITGSAAMSLLQTAAEGARSGNANLVDVTNALDATIASGIGGIQNYSQAMGALNAIVGAGDMSMQDLADAMGSGLMAVAKSYGQSIDDIGAALATFGDNNIRGARAATDLKMAMQALLSPVKTGQSYLEHLGLSMKDLGQTMMHHGLTAAIQQFVEHLKAAKVPISDWGEYVTNIFGKKAGAGIGVLVDQLDRLKSKMPDVAKGAKNFGNAWAATQQTTSQKLHELEASFQSLMIKIGSALLPVVNKFMTALNNALPGIEKAGGQLANLVKPVVTAFFKGLGGVVKELGGFLKGNAPSLEKFGKQVVKLAVPVVHTFFDNLLGIIKLLVGDIEGWLPKFEKLGVFIAKLAVPAVGLFFIGLGGILKLLLGPLKDVTLAVLIATGVWKGLNLVLDMNPFTAIAAALVILVGVIIKYHKQIFTFIEKAWNDIYGFFSMIIGKITGFFADSWDKIWAGIKTAWDAISGWFTSWWDDEVSGWEKVITGVTGWFKGAWDKIWGDIKTVWHDISTWLATWWDDEVKGWEKAVTTVEGWLKGAWNTVWGDIKQVWNAISSWFTTWWSNEISGWEKVVTKVEGWFVTAWDTVKTDAIKGFDDVRHEIAHIWDEIVTDVQNFIKQIEQAIEGIGKTILGVPGKVIGSIGSALGLAGGGVLAGYAPGHDSIPARLSPGEAVLVPEAVRAIGPGNINAINAHYSAGRTRGGDGAYAGGGVVSYYAAGGIADGGLSPYEAGQAAGQAYTASQGGSASKDGATFNLYFQGTQWPTPEQQQAMMSRLALLAGAM